MPPRTRRSLGLTAIVLSGLFVAGRFYLRHIGQPHYADICTIVAFTLIVVSGWLRHSAHTRV